MTVGADLRRPLDPGQLDRWLRIEQYDDVIVVVDLRLGEEIEEYGPESLREAVAEYPTVGEIVVRSGFSLPWRACRV